jgi:hypothetical protein
MILSTALSAYVITNAHLTQVPRTAAALCSSAADEPLVPDPLLLLLPKHPGDT